MRGSSRSGFTQSSDVISRDSDNIDATAKRLGYIRPPLMADRIPSESYHLPDGRIISLKEERFITTECLFQPNILGLKCPAIHDLVPMVIKMCDDPDIISNIVFSGGTTKLKGFRERMVKEMGHVIDPSAYATPDVDPQILPWNGASIFGSSSAMGQFWMRKKDYEEQGSSIVHQMCLT
eukprot:TRINITY_DN4468_c0_g2_i1.p2 TRINITY_DN4468_c0_g2~~TRINITY_DN4468_c0_g2_i1.p2  ORF type:complete len:179 (-),score=54.17 TRINITY_DN4468_c0_g2_i1:41-577(-)